MIQLCRLFLAVLMLVLPLFTVANAQEYQIPKTREQIKLSFAPLVEKAAPAVVNIFSKQKVKHVRPMSPLFDDPFFKRFFGDNSPFRHFGMPRQEDVTSLGSGVVVRSDGLIVSNSHVVGNNTEITIVLNDKREYEAEVVLKDERSDLALLKIKDLPDNELLPYLKLADSDDLEVGDLVLAIGNPFGVGQTVTSGIVSALARTNVEVSDFQYFIQTDAAINPGNSGGALLDMDGEVVGINTAIFSKSGGSMGIGFAIPSNLVQAVINAASNGGKIVRPWLGATSQNINQEIADSLGLRRPVGVLVKSVFQNSAAQKAGLKKGDVIIKVDDKEVDDEKALRFRIATFELGKEVDFTIIRDGKEKIITIEMLPPMEIPPREETKIEGDNYLSGLVIANLSPALGHEMNIHTYEGVVVMGVWNRSPAKRLGLGRGDIIQKINGKEIKSVKQFIEIVEDMESNVIEIIVKRGVQVLSVTIRG